MPHSVSFHRDGSAADVKKDLTQALNEAGSPTGLSSAINGLVGNAASGDRSFALDVVSQEQEDGNLSFSMTLVGAPSGKVQSEPGVESKDVPAQPTTTESDTTRRV